MRPQARPSTMLGAASITSASPISLVMAASFPRSRSLSNPCHAIRRSAVGRMTESMPRSETPRRINGATEVGKSMPPASPQAATAPPQRVIETTLASVVEPTASMPPAQRPFPSGFAGPASSLRSMDPGRAQAFQIIGLLRPPARSRDLKATVAKNCNRDRPDAPVVCVVRPAPVAPPAARRSAN